MIRINAKTKSPIVTNRYEGGFSIFIVLVISKISMFNIPVPTEWTPSFVNLFDYSILAGTV